MSATPPPIVTEADICRWIGEARPGDRLEYHRGHLARDYAKDIDTGSARNPLKRIARRARWVAETGAAHLVQVRHGPDDYSYLLIARQKQQPEAAIHQQPSLG